MVVGYVRCTKMYPCRQSSRADSGVLPACKRRTTSLDVRVCCVRRVEKSCVIICLCTASYNHVSVSSFISWRILWWGWMRSGRDFRRRELHEPRTAGCTACSIARLPESCLVLLSIFYPLYFYFLFKKKSWVANSPPSVPKILLFASRLVELPTLRSAAEPISNFKMFETEVGPRFILKSAPSKS